MATHEEDSEAWLRQTLEPPELNADGQINWDRFWLYRRRAGVPQPRPHFTGDVFVNVSVIGEDAPATVMILQHPCALMDKENILKPVLLVAKLFDYKEILPRDWVGNYDVLPLVVNGSGSPKHEAAALDQLALVRTSDLDITKRIACMEIEAVARLLQRWTNVNTRVIVPSWRFVKVVEAQFAEANGMEAWCTQRQHAGVRPAEALKEATAWLDASNEDTGRPRRELLKDPQNRKRIIRRMHDLASQLSEQEIAEKQRVKAERKVPRESAMLAVAEHRPNSEAALVNPETGPPESGDQPSSNEATA